MEPIAVSIKAAGASLGIGRTSVYRFLKEGRLESFSAGRRRLITIASIRAFVTAAQASEANR